MTASNRDVRCYSKSGIQGFGFHQKNDNAALAVRFGSLADISGHLQCKTACPLYPQERTLGGASDLSKQHHFSIIDGGSKELALQPLLDLHSFR